MRIARPTPAVVLVISALAGFGCDSTQPDRVETRVASVSVSTQALVDIFDCYEVWLDESNPPDGVPDTQFGEFCQPATPPAGSNVFKAQRPVPWRYAMSISIIPSGTTSEIVVQSLTGQSGSSVQPGDGIPDFVSMTDYDPTVSAAPAKTPSDNIYYLNGKQVSQGSQVYIESLGLNFGPANVLKDIPTFDFNVNSGDTVIVRARKQPVAETPPFISFDQDPSIQLGAVLAIGGVPVTVSGTSSTSVDDKAGFSFSFTVQ